MESKQHVRFVVGGSGIGGGQIGDIAAGSNPEEGAPVRVASAVTEGNSPCPTGVSDVPTGRILAWTGRDEFVQVCAVQDLRVFAVEPERDEFRPVHEGEMYGSRGSQGRGVVALIGYPRAACVTRVPPWLLDAVGRTGRTESRRGHPQGG